MTLCQNCRNINLTNLNRGTHPRTYRRSILCLSSFAVLQASAKALLESAENGCPLCAKFWNILSRQGTLTTELFTTLADGRWPGEEEGKENPRVILSWHYMKDESDWMFNGNTLISCGKWGMNCDPRAPLPDNLQQLFSRGVDIRLQSGSTKSLDDHTGSDINMELARTWLQDCQLNHKGCVWPLLRKAHTNVPSRLIHVADLAKPYVLRVEEHLDQDDYLTLSYCWGHGKRLLNTKATAEAFQTCLPTDDRMPATFREAFQVTKALGYQYIWIDALCILQDDPLDLQKEMTKMGDIYQNSAITIFAGKGPSVQAGLFAFRNGPSFKPISVSIQSQDRDSDAVHQQEVTFMSESHSSEDPLSTRAWILQEQILAQRQLTFTPREITWTCKTKQLSESFPQHRVSKGSQGTKGYIKQPRLALIRSLVASLNTTTTASRPSAVSRYHFSVWYNTVENYNARNLTVASDKLPAISAIAKRIHTHRGCEYGAGLFKDDLQVGLCWTTDRAGSDIDVSILSIDEMSQEVAQDYIAPSWSWASIGDTSLRWGSGGDIDDLRPEDGLEVLDWDFTYAPGAMRPFGEITSGELTVRGHTQQYLLVPLFGQEEWHQSQRRTWGAYAVEPSTTTIVDTVALDTPKLYCEMRRRFDGLNCTIQDFKASPVQFLSRALPVSCLTTCVTKHPTYRGVRSLVLVPSASSSDGFRRIGLLMTSSISNEWWDRSFVNNPRQTVKII